MRQGLITNQNRWGGVKQTIAISSRFASKKSASFICQNNVLQNKCLANLILVDHFIFTPFVLSNGILDCICWREIYNSFVFPRWNPGQAVSSEIFNQFVGRTVTSENPFLPSNSNWKSNNQAIWSSKKSTHTRPLTKFSLTLAVFPRKWNEQL